jgi:transposase
MKTWSIDIRRRVVTVYESGLSGTYAETAEMFGVGEATVSRWLRRKRETGDVIPTPRKGNRPRKVDLDWLRKHAEEHPDARLIDRVEAWEAQSGVRVHVDTMSSSLRAIGWTFKKNANGKRARPPRS